MLKQEDLKLALDAQDELDKENLALFGITKSPSSATPVASPKAATTINRHTTRRRGPTKGQHDKEA